MVPRAWIEDGSLYNERDARILFKILSLVNPGRAATVHGQELRSGQVLIGTQCLEKLLGIPRTTIHYHLKKFEHEGKIQIRVLPNRGGSVITIPALRRDGSGTHYGTHVGTQSGTIQSALIPTAYAQNNVGNGTQSGTPPETPLGTK